MKKGVILSWSALALLSSVLLLSCKTVTPPPDSSEPRQAATSVAPAPSSETSPVTKPATPPVIWWGPRPETTEEFMKTMKKYYPDWHRWFTRHPEEIGDYFQPPAPVPAVITSPLPPENTTRARLLEIEGTVKKLNEEARTIEVKRKRRSWVMAFDDETKITQAGVEIPLSSLKEETNVLIRYRIEGNKKKMIATTIAVVSPPAATRSEKLRQSPAR